MGLQHFTIGQNSNNNRKLYRGISPSLHAAAILKQINGDLIFFDCCCLPFMSFRFLPLYATRGAHD